MVELCVECEGSYRENQECNIRIQQEVQNTLLHRHGQLIDPFADEMQRHALAVKALDGAPFELLEQCLPVGRNHIDQVLLKSFLVSPGLRLADGAFCELHISSSRTNERAHKGS